MADVELTKDEVKVLKQITSLKYQNTTPAVDLDFVASEAGLSFEQTETALKGLHYNKANILKTFHNERHHWMNVIISDWTYQVSRSFDMPL